MKLDLTKRTVYEYLSVGVISSYAIPNVGWLLGKRGPMALSSAESSLLNNYL